MQEAAVSVLENCLLRNKPECWTPESAVVPSLLDCILCWLSHPAHSHGFGLNKMYSYTVIINSTNKYRKHKNNILMQVLPLEEMMITYTFTMARRQFFVKVKGNKTKLKLKSTTTKRRGGGGGGRGGKRQITN